MISANLICSSVSQQDIRIDTFKVRYPWQIHGEVMTHRKFSRNASSNRAIPIAKMLEETRNSELRAYPSFSVMGGPGMQGGPSTNEDQRNIFRTYWNEAAHAAADWAEQLAERGVSKQDVNRLLMPFTHANVIITATEFMNFFGLRLDKAADPTMRGLAEAMWREYNEAKPVLLQPGQWHLPFVDTQDIADLIAAGWDDGEETRRVSSNTNSFDWYAKDSAIKVSVARCARVSYESFETKKRSTVEEDLLLYDRLLGGLSDPTKPLHASPAEHQAMPDSHGSRGFSRENWDHKEEWGNFTGWRQYRKMLPGEAVAPLPEEYR